MFWDYRHQGTLLRVLLRAGAKNIFLNTEPYVCLSNAILHFMLLLFFLLLCSLFLSKCYESYQSVPPNKSQSCRLVVNRRFVYRWWQFYLQLFLRRGKYIKSKICGCGRPLIIAFGSVNQIDCLSGRGMIEIVFRDLRKAENNIKKK